MKFTKTELDNIKKLTDSIKAKDDNKTDINDILQEMYDLANDIYFAKHNYTALMTRFNNIRSKIIRENNTDELKELKLAVERKQKLDKMAGF